MGLSARKLYVRKTRTIHPRTRMGLRLYETGGARTLKEAAEIAGCNRHNLSVLRNNNPMVMQYITELREQLDAGAVNTSSVIRTLGQKALLNIARLMENGEKEETRLKAAQDLADRSPETSKTNKISLEGDVTIKGSDAADLMAALVQASQAAAQFRGEVSSGDYVKVDDGRHLVPAALPAGLPPDD